MRGNPAMRSKRVTGPSAQSIMLTHIRLERCKVAGCKNPVVTTKNPDGLTKIRACIEHTSAQVVKSEPFDPRSLLKLPWQ